MLFTWGIHSTDLVIIRERARGSLRGRSNGDSFNFDSSMAIRPLTWDTVGVRSLVLRFSGVLVPLGCFTSGIPGN